MTSPEAELAKSALLPNVASRWSREVRADQHSAGVYTSADESLTAIVSLSGVKVAHHSQPGQGYL